MESDLNLNRPILRRERESDYNLFPDNFLIDINNWIMKRGTIHSIEDILYHINMSLNIAIEEGKIDHFNEEEKKKIKGMPYFIRKYFTYIISFTKYYQIMQYKTFFYYFKTLFISSIKCNSTS